MKLISLFSGCGGLDLGFLNAGHEIVFANDFDKDCVLTYKKNIGNHILLKDIYDLQGDEIPEGDIISAGFPCQGFSIANPYRNKDDDRNHLYLEMCRIVNEITPKFFIFENVKGILSLEKGEVIKIIENDFDKLGVTNSHPGYDRKRFLLNAVNYGVPQNRQRVIWIGISKTIDHKRRELFWDNFPPKITNTGDENSPFYTIKDAIGDLPSDLCDDSEKIYNHHGTKHKVKINGYLGNRKLDWNKPSPTMVGRGGGTGGPVIAIHPNLKRRLSVRETARCQTFPDDFKFYGSISSQYRQIGNAVAVKFAEKIADVFKDFEDNKLKYANGSQIELNFNAMV